MKPFDLEKAKKGASVCRRDGTPVKILDFDFAGGILYKFTTNGVVKTVKVRPDGSSPFDRRDDIFMAPTIAYTKIYKNTYSNSLFGGKLVATKAEAEQQKSYYEKGIEEFCIAKIELL